MLMKDIIEGRSKISFTATSPRITVLKSIADILGLTTRDRICFTVGETLEGEHRLECRFNFADKRSVCQPPLPVFESFTNTCMAIRSTARRIHYISISSRVLAHHVFHEGDKFRWLLVLDDDDVVEARIDYLPVKVIE